jgi:hypothetical protein
MLRILAYSWIICRISASSACRSAGSEVSFDFCTRHVPLLVDDGLDDHLAGGRAIRDHPNEISILT